MSDLLSLAQEHTSLRPMSRQSGWWEGPCPRCDGTDRFQVNPHRRWQGKDLSGVWLCRFCTGGRYQDIIALLRHVEPGLSYRAACERLELDPAHPQSVEPVAQEREEDPTWPDRALDYVEHAEVELWRPAGERARAWLNARGLRDETLRRWRIGFTDATEAKRDAWFAGFHVERAIIVPWFLAGRLVHVNRRRPTGEPKYRALPGGRPCIFGAESIRPGRPVLLVEGEFDAMLLAQEAGDLAAVATLGGCRAPLTPDAVAALLPAVPIILAYDNDERGQAGVRDLVARFPHRFRSVTVPLGKDVTEFWQAHGSLRDWTRFILRREINVHPLPTGNREAAVPYELEVIEL